MGLTTTLSTWSNTSWRARLHSELEPMLKSSTLPSDISTYQGVPFGLFAYPPTAEREVRKEITLLKTRIEHETPREVSVLSMADLLWRGIRSAYPPDGGPLFDAEKSMQGQDAELRLSELQETVRAVLSELSPLPDMIREHADTLIADKHILFLTRVGALYPAYRASALLENLMGVVRLPTVLFYPGTRVGTNQLRFMDSLEALHGYRHKIF